MLKRIWESMELATYEDWARIREGIRALNPKICGFDTETTGLHIILDKPFLFQFGFAHPTNEHKGYTFLVDLRVNKDAERIISEWHEICSKADVYLGCNITFDLHMLRNIGIEYGYDNVAELRAYIRYSGDAIQTEHGGPPLKLKDFTAMYVDPSAKYHERLLKNERSAIAKSYNLKLKMMLSHLGAPPKEYKANSYTLSVIEKMFKDPLFDESDLEDKVKEVYLRWKQEVLPQYLQDKVQSIVETDMIRYTELDTKTLYKYAHLDVVYLIEDYEKVLPILKYRHNEKAVELDNSLIYPFLDMECTGFLVDKEYLESARVKLKEYTLARRQVFKQLAGCDIKIGQHEKILEILRNKYHADVSSTNSDVLQTFKNQLLRENKKDEVIGFIDVLSELRTLEKWYATYIVRFQKALKYTDRLYTQIDAQGAVSGRISSDFQQFPKEPIKTIDGEEIFHPRRFVIVPDNCKGLLYLDYSQIELRFQAMYTILVGEPDLNMCRAYMPYKCHNHQGVEFDYKNPGHIKKWNEEWFTDESNEKWIKTDVHGATTLSAFKSMGLTKDSPNFHALRYVGKRVNFAKNYGASLPKIIEMFPEYSYEQCKEIDGAYYIAFPGVKAYHNYCFMRARNFEYTSNLFGVRYYGANGHKLRNLLVQGSAAHFLKYRIRAIWEFLRDNHLQSRLQIQIHDELAFEISKADPPIAKQLKNIMEDWNDALVPIVAEAEITNTSWADKRDLEL